MATAALAGYGGVVTTSSGATEIKTWSASATVDALDATSFDSAGYKEYIIGLKGMTGSFTCIGTPPNVLGQSVVASLTLKTKSSGGVSFVGNSILTNLQPGVPVDGIVSFTCDFVFTGTITVS